jgi:branched-chain amino acid transport system substrate-binding protein
MYFNYAGASPLLKQFVREYKPKYGEHPPYERHHSYFTMEAYKAAVEKAYKAAGEWPTKEQVAKALEGIEVESLSGKRWYREDHIQMCNFFQGITTHKNEFDFVTIDPVKVLPTTKIMKPSAGAKLYDWINATFPIKL